MITTTDITDTFIDDMFNRNYVRNATDIHPESDDEVMSEYFDVMHRTLGKLYPNLHYEDIEEAIAYSCEKRYKMEPCKVYNSYTEQEVEMTLRSIANYIKEREVCSTAWGVLWKKSTAVPNPLVDMTASFMDNREINKKEMFKYQKGSEGYEKYNLLQLLCKLDSNALYGCLGQFSCLFYNLHVSASITSQARALISATGLLFEAFLANNVKFGSLDQVIAFIDNVAEERFERQFNTHDILDHIPTVDEVFLKIVNTCGFEWIPTRKQLSIIKNYLYRQDSETLTRVFYKNNLYGFMENIVPTKAMEAILSGLKSPLMDPNKPNKEIKVEIDLLKDLLKEFVYYKYQYCDRIDRMDNMIKSVCVLSDTDSAIVSFDAWYHYNLNKVHDKAKGYELMKHKVNLIDKVKEDIFGEVTEPLFHSVDAVYDYDFFNEEVLEKKRQVDLIHLIPEDNLKFSIINIIAYIMTDIVNDYIKRFCDISFSKVHEGGGKGFCFNYLKNEFLMSYALLTMNKKNYATKQQLQEGNIVPEDKSLDIKGLALNKSSMNATTRKRLKKILYDDILNVDMPSQLQILKDLAIFEKEIFKSLESGQKNYYKPVVIKAINNYEEPFRIQGIKAAVAWNELRDSYIEPFDLEERNNLDIVKVNINPKTIEYVKESHPEVYKRMVRLVGDGVNPPAKEFKDVYKGNITALGIPKDCNVPDWVIPFINYNEIINANLKVFPIDSIGCNRLGKDKVNYTNIIAI